MMDVVDDLVTWLRAQLDDDDRAALAFPEGDRDWRHDVIPDPTGPDHVLLIGDRVISAGFFEDDPLRPKEVEHIARHDPARALREVDATRRILDRWEASQDDNLPPLALIALDEVVKALALPYSDRPGYREEWRP